MAAKSILFESAAILSPIIPRISNSLLDDVTDVGLELHHQGCSTIMLTTVWYVQTYRRTGD